MTHSKQQKPASSKINLTITAIDDGWIMGESLSIQTYPDITLANLAHIIYERKEKAGTTIRPHQMKFYLPPPNHRHLTNDQWWGKSLIVCGIKDGAILQLEPIISRCWLWHPMMFYHDRFRNIIQKVLSSYNSLESEEEDGMYDRNDDDMMAIEELERRVPLPPPLKQFGYLSFVRMYPELFYVEVSKGGYEVSVQINRDGSLPIWL